MVYQAMFMELKLTFVSVLKSGRDGGKLYGICSENGIEVLDEDYARRVAEVEGIKYRGPFFMLFSLLRIIKSTLPFQIPTTGFKRINSFVLF